MPGLFFLCPSVVDEPASPLGCNGVKNQRGTEPTEYEAISSLLSVFIIVLFVVIPNHGLEGSALE